MIIEKERKKKKDELVWVNLYLTLAINKTEQGSSSILTVPGPQQWASSTPQFCRNKTPNLMTIVVTDIININVCKVLQNCNTFTGQVYCPLKYSKTIHWSLDCSDKRRVGSCASDANTNTRTTTTTTKDLQLHNLYDLLSNTQLNRAHYQYANSFSWNLSSFTQWWHPLWQDHL